MLRPIAFLLLLTSLSFAQQKDQLRCPEAPSSLKVQHGTFEYRPGINFQLSQFSATLISRGKSLPLCLAKTTNVQHGVEKVAAEDLTRLFDQKLQQSGQNSKLSDVKVEMKDNEVLISGTAHKGPGVHFSIQGPVDVFNARYLRLHARKASALGLPIKGLLEMLGMDVGDVMQGSTKGIIVQQNDIFFDPAQLGHINGHISAARIADNHLQVTFAAAPHKSAARVEKPASHRNARSAAN
jgi:hypothetical protein